ncbi:phosphoketolase family protein [Inquilinus sp. OTU3971]|uniref:phosphoketolase family protein n=1 Tax=Inquilinus sp. OTU3971 TaxID=3043855 RepID=UPI00406BFEA0
MDRLPQLGTDADRARRRFQDRLAEHHDHVRRHGRDMPDIADWSWPGDGAAGG